MRLREKDRQLFLDITEHPFKGKELIRQIIGSGLGVTYLKEGTLIVVRIHKSYIFQIKQDLDIFFLDDDSYIEYIPGSIVNLSTGKPLAYFEYTPRFKSCRLPTISELHKYEKYSTV